MVVCQPGITEVAKSNDTIVCTESTSGVARPANTKETSSKRCQSFALPLHPKERIEYIFLLKGVIALSRIIAKSGKRPVDRKSTRLNSSHVRISYAVFCLKKKKKKQKKQNNTLI